MKMLCLASECELKIINLKLARKAREVPMHPHMLKLELGLF
jgi:hypothetical protein